MSTYCQALYQIVFSTKNREKTLTAPDRERLFAYMSGIPKKKNCYVFTIGGVDDHVHILVKLHPSVALASLVKDIKLACSKFIKDEHLFSKFEGWQDGYGAFTYSMEARTNLIRYIENQEEHHRKLDYRQEFIGLLSDFEIDFDERYLM